jgi:predicted nucleotidyltransferase
MRPAKTGGALRCADEGAAMTVQPHLQIAVDRGAITAFCQKWQIAEMALFGSVLRDDFDADSDVDVLVTFKKSARWTLWDWQSMTEELEQIFHRPVDLVSKKAVEQSENYIRRKRILEHQETIYASG